MKIGLGKDNNSIFAHQRLGAIMDKSSRKALRERLERSFGDNAFSSSAANSFLESLPRDLLFCLRCNNLVRGLNRTLDGTSLDRFVAFGSAASRGSKLIADTGKNKSRNAGMLSLFSESEADYFTSSSYENKALKRAKDMLNRPVASELLTSAIERDLKSERTKIPTFFEFLESYKVVLRVWSQTKLLDLFLWYRGTQGPIRTAINLG